jgi:predicted lipoprotein with Yx(FWY)xxD motif
MGDRPGPHRLLLAALILGTGLMAAACAGASNNTVLSGTPTTDKSVTLALEHSPDGDILTTGGGVTLYDFVPDTPTHSACLNDGCVFQWPPLIKSGPITVGPGVDQSLVGTLRRPDGSTQISYGGHPLYTYNLDANQPGVVSGQAIDQDGGLWYVLTPGGKEIHTSFSVSVSN